MRRPCIESGCPNTTTGARCPIHEAEHQVTRNASRPHLRGDWAKTSRRILAQWRDEHGDWCPGYQRSPHAVTDLTVDHVRARDAEVLTVLCRSCNSRKGAR